MNYSSSFAEAARRAFGNLSLELQKSAEDDNFTEELGEFIKIIENSDVDEEYFYQYLEFEHKDEDYAKLPYSCYSCYLMTMVMSPNSPTTLAK